MTRPARLFAPLVLLVALQPARAQRPEAASDTLGRRDSTAVVLEPLTVRASIIPSAGATVGSGVPARVSILSGRQAA